MAESLPSEELIDEPSDYGALRPGTRLGRYELLVPIARGGMARVWAARLHGQRGFQKLVAIKTILPHLASEPEFERMFLDEARIASGVHHPNVCEIYELGEEQRVLYLVMEWVSGDSFSRVLRVSGRTDPVEPRVVARIVADACAGLHSAHELTDDVGRELGVVHRDLSPHNILLTADGIAKVADFGVAKALGQLHEATSAGQLKGKIAYMSPEQISGSGIDRRSDIFSLGCVIYEATTGVRPFRGDNDAQVMHAVLKGEVAPPSSIVRGYPKELEHIVLRAMSAQPIVRFPTAERMRFALEEFLTRGPLVTQSNVAQVLKARIGENLERRRERIRQASSAGDQGTFDAGGREQQPDAHRSGVKQSRPMHTTLPIGAASPVAQQMQPSPGSNAPAGQSVTPSPYSPSGQPMAPGIPGAPSATMPMAHPPPPHDPQHPQHPQHPPHPPQAQHPQQAPQQPQAMAMLTPLDATRVHDYSSSGVGRPLVTVPPASGGGYPAPAEAPGPVEPPPPGGGQYAIAIGIGIVFAVMISVGSVLIWKSHEARTRAESSAAPSDPPAASATSSAEGAASAAPGASTSIELRVVPSEARISVDGRELGPEERALPRPAAGTTVPLVVHAPGYEDATLMIDYFTASPLDVTLKAKDVEPAVDPAGEVDVDPAPPAPPPDEDPKPKTTPKAAVPKNDPAGGLPANPY